MNQGVGDDIEAPRTERSYHHGNLRATLLETAIAELRNRDANDLSLRALARTIGVSQTAPYRHFADKGELIAAMATIGYQQLLATLTAASEQHRDSAADQLIGFAHGYVDFAVTNEQMFKLMFGPSVQPVEDYPELRAVIRDTFRLVQIILRQGMDSGQFREQDEVYLANVAWAGVHGLATLRVDSAVLFRSHIDLHAQVELGVQTFLAGIAAIDGARVPAETPAVGSIPPGGN